MNREIKHRLRIGNKIVGYEKWYEGAGDKANPCWLYSVDGEYWSPHYIHHKHKDSWTGLKDCNGKEIYESDIIVSRDISGSGKRRVFRPREVRWNQEMCEFNVSSPSKESTTEHEVIGNIWETPELLEA